MNTATQVAPQQRSKQYSVDFCVKVGDFIKIVKSCDWRWPEDDAVWNMSSRGDMELRWDCDGKLTEEGRQILLRKFKLTSIADQLPLSVIRHTSPAKLLRMRRKLEEARHCSRKIHPISSRVGGHISAEMAT